MLYKIERYCAFNNAWHTLMPFSFLDRVFSDGAWSMLRSIHNSGISYTRTYGEKFRLVDENNNVEDVWTSPKVKTNWGAETAICVLDALNLHGFVFREIGESYYAWRDRLRDTYGIFDDKILNALSLALTANKDKGHDDDN